METVQVRMEVRSKESAEVAYLSQSLGISKKDTYALIVRLFLFERDLSKAVANLKQYRYMIGELATKLGSSPTQDQE